MTRNNVGNKTITKWSVKKAHLGSNSLSAHSHTHTDLVVSSRSAVNARQLLFRYRTQAGFCVAPLRNPGRGGGGQVAKNGKKKER